MNEKKFLDGLYKQIPQFKCIEGCTDCCGPVFTTKTEAIRLGIEVGELSNVAGTEKCRFAGDNGCTRHDDRPLMCRLYGASNMEHLVCPKGRGPLKRLKDNETVQLIKKYKAFVIMDAEKVKNQIPKKEVANAA